MGAADLTPASSPARTYRHTPNLKSLVGHCLLSDQPLARSPHCVAGKPFASCFPPGCLTGFGQRADAEVRPLGSQRRSVTKHNIQPSLCSNPLILLCHQESPRRHTARPNDFLTPSFLSISPRSFSGFPSSLKLRPRQLSRA